MQKLHAAKVPKGIRYRISRFKVSLFAAQKCITMRKESGITEIASFKIIEWGFLKTKPSRLCSRLRFGSVPIWLVAIDCAFLLLVTVGTCIGLRWGPNFGLIVQLFRLFLVIFCCCFAQDCDRTTLVLNRLYHRQNRTESTNCYVFVKTIAKWNLLFSLLNIS